MELCEEQEATYQDCVLPPKVTARIIVEDCSPLGWQRDAGASGIVLGMQTFGMSAPMEVVAEQFTTGGAGGRWAQRIDQQGEQQWNWV